jgi:hypothetical protein
MPKADIEQPSTPLIPAGAATVPGNGNGHHHTALPAAAPPPEPAPSAAVEERLPASALTAATATSAGNVLSQLVQIVSERTGYPEEMLDVDSNIEADLGIDSIKRMEILAAFQQLHQGTDRAVFQNVMEKLTTRKTLRETAAALGEVLERRAVA